MPPDVKWPLLGLALLGTTGCPDEPQRPSAQALEACNGQNMGDEDFDWDCCDVWIDECLANGDPDCEWICNG